MLLTGLSESEFVPVVVCAHPGMSKMALLGCILDELDIPRPGGRENAQKYLEALHSYLMQAYAMGQRVLVVIDEAHFLPSDQLHMVRTLTNLETPQEKLCTIIMLAEETFPQRLRHKKYSSLRSRISLGSYLMPLSRQEAEQYIKFRLMVAGAVEEIIEPECYELMHSRSGGICREVSKLADSMLLEAFLRGENRVTTQIARQCIQNSI
jgi:general secretion pathway protein A